MRIVKYCTVLLLLFLLILLVGCTEEIKDVSQKERVEMWIGDYNASDYGSIKDNFYSGMTNYPTLIVDSDYWDPSKPDVNLFKDTVGISCSITTNSQATSTTRTVIVTGDAPCNMTISFRKDPSEDGEVWLIDGITGDFFLN